MLAEIAAIDGIGNEMNGTVKHTDIDPTRMIAPGRVGTGPDTGTNATRSVGRNDCMELVPCPSILEEITTPSVGRRIDDIGIIHASRTVHTIFRVPVRVIGIGIKRLMDSSLDAGFPISILGGMGFTDGGRITGSVGT